MTVTVVKQTNAYGSSISSVHHSGKGAGRTVSIPSIPKMITKGQCKLSEDELIAKITEMAKRDAAAGIDSQYAGELYGSEAPTAEWRSLQRDFISLVSPDRTKNIKNTMQNLAGLMSTMGLSGSGVDHRFEFFEILFGNSDKFGSNVEVGGLSFYDEEGNIVAGYDKYNGWYTCQTPAENSRAILFIDLWKQALADAEAELDVENEQRVYDKNTEMSFSV